MDTRMKASLDTIRIPTPCTKAWDELTGDERRRYCDACHLNVTNLSALTRREADEFLAAKTGRTCVSYVQRTDGSIVTREEHHPWARDAWAWVRPGVAALFTLLPFLTACEQTPSDEPQPSSDDVRALGRPAATLGEIRISGDFARPIEPGGTSSTETGSSLEPLVDPTTRAPEPPR
jgi:hypothetical protein